MKFREAEIYMTDKTLHETGCKTCSQLTALKIKVPSDLLACIGMIKCLIENGGFEKVSSNFELENPKTPDGYWKDDLMYYAIRCKECGQLYSCICDTYHGSGKFGKE